MTTHEKIYIMQAWEEGQQIERKHSDKVWIPQNKPGQGPEPCWNWEHSEYRMEPPKPLEVMVWVHRNGNIGFYCDDACKGQDGWTKKKFREVVE